MLTNPLSLFLDVFNPSFLLNPEPIFSLVLDPPPSCYLVKCPPTGEGVGQIERSGGPQANKRRGNQRRVYRTNTSILTPLLTCFSPTSSLAIPSSLPIRTKSLLCLLSYLYHLGRLTCFQWNNCEMITPSGFCTMIKKLFFFFFSFFIKVQVKLLQIQQEQLCNTIGLFIWGQMRHCEKLSPKK